MKQSALLLSHLYKDPRQRVPACYTLMGPSTAGGHWGLWARAAARKWRAPSGRLWHQLVAAPSHWLLTPQSNRRVCPTSRQSSLHRGSPAIAGPWPC